MLTMKNTIFLLLGLLMPINNAIAATVIDQDFLIEWNSFNQFNENPFAQTFTVGVTGQLEQIDLVLSQLDPTGNLVNEVQNTFNGSPIADNPNVLASLLIPLNQLPSSSPGGTGPGVVNIDLSSANLSVTAGDEFAIVLHKDQGGLTGQYGVAWFGSSDPNLSYSNGSGWMLGAEGPGCGDIIIFGDTTPPTGDCWPAWIESSTSNYTFKTYVSTIPLPPTFVLLLSGLIGMFLPQIRKLKL